MLACFATRLLSALPHLIEQHEQKVLESKIEHIITAFPT